MSFGSMTLFVPADAAREYLAYQKARGQSPRTLVLSRTTLGLFLDYLESRAIRDLRVLNDAVTEDYSRHIRAYRAPGQKSGPAPATVASRLRPVRGFLKFLVKRQILLYAPELATVPRPDPLPRHVPTEEDMPGLCISPTCAPRRAYGTAP